MDNQYSYYNPNETEGNTSNGTTFYNNGQGDDGKTPKKKKEHKKMPKAVAVTGLALMFGVVSSATFLTTNYVGTKVLKLGTTQKSTSTTSTSAVTSNASLTKTSSVVTSDVSSVVENVMPSIVSITNMSVQEVQNYFGGTSKQESESAGTGIIISQNDSELLVVTNNHVVAGSDTLTVTFADGNSVEANIKGTDSEYDVAVVAVPLDSISEDTKKAISVATLGDSTELKVGEPAIAIGNALGYGQSVTTGVISALNRSVSETDQTTGETTESSVKLIQTDAAINPGNSGGALVNASGEVIGINSSKLVGDSVEGVGYAIPISDVSDLIENLMNQETKTKVAEADQGAIGIKGMSVSTEYSQQLNMPEGVYVSEVTKGGGAEKAGMTRGCIITGINGTTVSSMDDLQEQLQYYAKGDEVELTIQVPQSNGEYQEQSVNVTLGAKQTSK
ncbi:S1C family serine protease [[Ruminococcus] lactaris]|uniref:Trypsin n=1 Tax=[Ruminococcus] lactaris ATCC 29176 TaxID=471875 RepID=B5CPA5_9FIRM|nr:trypsin-like peptidase domain-containing protein [[Ruminococcus] lactaris]EDY33011.1 trypsin [[Ruminococcus] lactaris ATCC 29176]MCB5442125.1 trypsin-like peptidase domain-containing protein [[Ruminococcus] lactaris]MCB5532224.1 trypsin-like peptidase domain-containing protein [[Ruminococcus] lactaris]UWP64619.1 trypsin-like peptidase domain-containing protein [[Ruminococcus] lactaris ATCC 29176]